MSVLVVFRNLRWRNRAEPRFVTNLTCSKVIGVYMASLVALTLIVSEILWFIRTDRQTVALGYIDSAVNDDQEYIYFVGLEMPPSVFYGNK